LVGVGIGIEVDVDDGDPSAVKGEVEALVDRRSACHAWEIGA
jgi:hypothetical protein